MAAALVWLGEADPVVEEPPDPEPELEPDPVVSEELPLSVLVASLLLVAFLVGVSAELEVKAAAVVSLVGSLVVVPVSEAVELAVATAVPLPAVAE